MPERKQDGDLASAVADLYAGSLESFTADRNALAKRLRGSGAPEQAEQVAALRKPTVAAWGVNRGTRSDPAAARRLVESGRRLDAAQAAVLKGKGGGGLRAAMSEQQAAIDAMVEAVQAELERAGRASPAVLDRVRDTLRAVGADEEARAEFASGRLARDRQPIGFGEGAAAGVTPRRPRGRRKPTAAQRKRAKARVSKASKELDAAVKRVTEARRRVTTSKRTLEQAREQAERAEARQSTQEAKLAEARAALEALEQQESA